jgi:hypothetical protein
MKPNLLKSSLAVCLIVRPWEASWNRQSRFLPACLASLRPPWSPPRPTTLLSFSLLTSLKLLPYSLPQLLSWSQIPHWSQLLSFLLASELCPSPL